MKTIKLQIGDIVQFNSNMNSSDYEFGVEEGGRAIVKQIDTTDKEFCKITFDIAPFAEYNKRFEKPVWYTNGTSDTVRFSETKFYQNAVKNGEKLYVDYPVLFSEKCPFDIISPAISVQVKRHECDYCGATDTPLANNISIEVERYINGEKVITKIETDNEENANKFANLIQELAGIPIEPKKG